MTVPKAAKMKNIEFSAILDRFRENGFTVINAQFLMNKEDDSRLIFAGCFTAADTAGQLTSRDNIQ